MKSSKPLTIGRNDIYAFSPFRRCGIILLTVVAISTCVDFTSAIASTVQNLFVAVRGGAIYQYTPNGAQSTFASGLANPYGVACDSAGDVFVSVWANGSGSILEFTPGGVQSTFASGLTEPSCMAFDSAGNLYVSDYGRGVIFEITPAGTERYFRSGLSNPSGLAFDAAGNLFVGTGGGNIIEYMKSGVPESGTLLASVKNNLENGTTFRLAFDRAGNLFVSDSDNDAIYKFANTGNHVLNPSYTTFRSGLDLPWGLAFDSAGDLFEADMGSGKINEFEYNDGTLSSSPVTFASGVYTLSDLAFQPVPGPSYLVSTNAYWSVTDITDPGQPVALGELQAPFTKPNYPLVPGVPPYNTPWHVDGSTAGNQLSMAFGTTTSGGASGLGTVYALTDNKTNDLNISPNQLLLSGNVFYGTTFGDGVNDIGTVFKVNADGLGFVTLHVFTGPDGSQPQGGSGGQAGLVLGPGGVLYGTTTDGGANNDGVVFSIKTDGTGFTVVHSFNGNDGENPCAGLVLGPDDILYGTTEAGGANNAGTVFSINIDNGNAFTSLYSFTGGNDGGNPYSTLALGSGGLLYGTCVFGGANDDGVVFSFNTAGNVLTPLYSFTGGNDGEWPLGELILSGSMLYGTAIEGGANSAGVVFSINIDNDNAFTPLYSFTDGNDGGFPFAGLVISGGVLYGVTSYGGANSDGTVFSIDTENGNAFTPLYSFTSANGSGYNGLVIAGGELYGTTPAGGANSDGTLFSINTTSGNYAVLTSFPPPPDFSILHSFSGSGGDGAAPYDQLAISGSSYYGTSPVLYGTTAGGGANGYGTIFAMNTNGNSYTVLHSFTSSDPGPISRLLISGNTLYGTTLTTVFRINTDGSGFATLATINGASELLLSLSGTTLYGTTVAGGANNLGMVFSITNDGSGFKDLHDFGTGSSDGASPNAGLDLSPKAFYNGQTVTALYGTTKSGGTYGKGTVFSINTDGSGYTPLYSFGSTTPDGSQPEAGMVLAIDPIYGTTTLYGTTVGGGANGLGTVFSISTSGGGDSILYNFTSSDGSGPDGKLAVLGDPSTPTLLGTTSGGGAHGDGMIFSLLNGNLTDVYDFSGSSDGASPNAGVTLTIGDHSDSIWSVDTTLNISDAYPSLIPQIQFAIGFDNSVALYVNGNLVYPAYTSDSWVTPGSLEDYILTGVLQAGPNDIRVIIGGDDDDNDYFTMAISNDSAIYTAATPALTGLSAGPGNADVTLSWNPVSGATSYNIYRSTTSGGPYGVPIGSSMQAAYTDTTAANGTTYYYEVSPVDVNVEGPLSSQAGPVTPELSGPTAPLNVVATAGANQVSLNWSPSSGATSYSIYRSTTIGGPYGAAIGNAAGTTYTDTTAANGTVYYYEVSAVAVSAVGPASGPVGPVTPEPAPSAASGLAATAGNEQVYLTWTVGGATSYNIYRSYTLIGTTTEFLPFYYDTTATNGVTYYYEISPVNIDVEGPYSIQVSATPAP